MYKPRNINTVMNEREFVIQRNSDLSNAMAYINKHGNAKLCAAMAKMHKDAHWYATERFGEWEEKGGVIIEVATKLHAHLNSR